MVNIILPVISNFENYANFIKSSKRKDVTFFVGVTKEGESFFSKSKFEIKLSVSFAVVYVFSTFVNKYIF